jgi:hypothetical protein
MGYGLYNGSDRISIPCIMGRTMVHTIFIPHEPWVVQQYVCPMVHGLYNGPDSIPHGPWVVQWYTHSMVYGLCNSSYPMCHGLYNGPDRIGVPCIMGCTTVHPPMGHGLYNGLYNSSYLMCHGLYNSMFAPWFMDCTTVQTVFVPHGPCIVQWYVFPMSHALYNGMFSP